MSAFRHPARVLYESEDRMWHCAWSHDGKLLAACGSDKKCRIWSVDENLHCTLLQVLGEDETAHTRTVRCCEFSPDSSLLCTASFDGTCVVWARKNNDASSSSIWTATATLEGHDNEVKSVAWNASGKLLATCGRDKTCWVWRMEEDNGEWNCISVLSEHEGDVKFVRFHPQREYEFYSCSYDNTVRVWQMDTDADEFVCQQTLRASKDTVWSLAFCTEGGERIVTAAQDGSLQSYGKNEFAGEAWEALFTVPQAHARPIFSLDCTLGNLLASASGDNSIALWRVSQDTGFISKLAQCHGAHEQDVNCVRFRPISSATVAASCGDDGKVKLWQIEAL